MNIESIHELNTPPCILAETHQYLRCLREASTGNNRGFSIQGVDSSAQHASQSISVCTSAGTCVKGDEVTQVASPNVSANGRAKQHDTSLQNMSPMAILQRVHNAGRWEIASTGFGNVFTRLHMKRGSSRHVNTVRASASASSHKTVQCSQVAPDRVRQRSQVWKCGRRVPHAHLPEAQVIPVSMPLGAAPGPTTLRKCFRVPRPKLHSSASGHPTPSEARAGGRVASKAHRVIIGADLRTSMLVYFSPC